MITSIAIMAHPSRKRLVEDYLKPLLPGATVVWDRRGDRWDTGRRALIEGLRRDNLGGVASDRHIVVQDDSILCSNFVEGVKLALQHVPDDCPASFYLGRSRPWKVPVEEAVAKAQWLGASWLVGQGPLWGPAVAFPTGRIGEILSACDRLKIPNYDTRIALYLASAGTDCWYSLPSLVDHRVGPDHPSLVPGRSSTRARVAHSFIGARHPFDVDWGAGGYPMRLPKVTIEQAEHAEGVAQKLASAGVGFSSR